MGRQPPTEQNASPEADEQAHADELIHRLHLIVHVEDAAGEDLHRRPRDESADGAGSSASAP
jgi:hypothetical protein